MGFANRFVVALLRSPAHRILSGSTAVIRYQGRRTGRTITTPVQYALRGEEVVILAGRPETKAWWRNFTDGANLDVLVRGRWLPMHGRTVRGATHPEQAAALLDAYRERFPKAERSLPGATPEDRVAGAVLVACKPR